MQAPKQNQHTSPMRSIELCLARESVQKVVDYYRDKNKREIDLLTHQDGKLFPIEIKKTASPDRSMIKSFSVLERKTENIPGSNCTSVIPQTAYGALICQIPQFLPIDEHNSYVPIGFV